MIINTVVKGNGGSAPAHYIEKSVDANGKLINGSTFIDLTGVTEISERALQAAYYKSVFPSNTSINMSSITSINGDNACEYLFRDSKNITSINLSNLVSISGATAMSCILYNTDITSLIF